MVERSDVLFGSSSVRTISCAARRWVCRFLPSARSRSSRVSAKRRVAIQSALNLRPVELVARNKSN